MRAFRVTVPETDEDLATALLWEAGTAGIEVRAVPGERTVLQTYFDGDPSFSRLGECVPSVEIEAVPIPDVDWVARFRQSFRAFRVGRFLVAPPWDDVRGEGERLVIDPGRAFGTGTHESTRLCFQALEKLGARRPLGRVIDIGTGTGILALAAVRLGASRAVATDTDPDALDSARAHAEVNATPLHLVRADGPGAFRPGEADLVLANITAPLLVEHAGGIAALRATGGAVVLSGLLEEDVSAVGAAYRACGEAEVLLDGEWAALLYGGTP